MQKVNFGSHYSYYYIIYSNVSRGVNWGSIYPQINPRNGGNLPPTTETEITGGVPNSVKFRVQKGGHFGAKKGCILLGKKQEKCSFLEGGQKRVKNGQNPGSGGQKSGFWGSKWPKSGVRTRKKGQNRWTFDWPFFGRVKFQLFGENGKIDGLFTGPFLGFWGSKMVKFWAKTKKCGKK